MKIELEDYGTGWFAATIYMTRNDVDTLIEKLQRLKAKQFEHFTINKSNNERADLESIEFYLCTEKEIDNADILGGNIEPTR